MLYYSIKNKKLKNHSHQKKERKLKKPTNYLLVTKYNKIETFFCDKRIKCEKSNYCYLDQFKLDSCYNFFFFLFSILRNS